MLLTRERWKSFLGSFGRPIGVTAGSPLEPLIKNANRVPRTPRIVTLLLLAAAGLILLHPDVRSCIRMSVRSMSTGYRDFAWQPLRWNSVKRLCKEAEKNRDPKLLALLALLSTDNAERLRLSDEAIRGDASLTWLDYELGATGPWGPDDSHTFHTLAPERMARLRKWDPDNTMPRELAAQIAAYRAGAQWGSISWPNQTGKYGLGIDGSEDQPPPDSKWLAAMDEVFSSAKYDNYSTQQFELVRYATDKYRVRDPDIALYVLVRRRIPNLLSLRSYNNWLLSQSLRKEKIGDTAGALADARKALQFAQRMSLGQKTTIEALMAGTLGIAACKRLQPLLENHGHAEEASLVAFQMASWNADIERIRFTNRSQGRVGQEAAEWASMTILMAMILILLAGLASFVGALVLWLKRTSAEARSRPLVLSSWALDAAPIVLLGTCSIVYLAYQPFAQAYSAYFSAEQPVGNFEGLYAAGSVTHVLPYSVTRVATPVLFWTVTTVALSLLAAFLLVRMVARRFRHA